MKAYATTVVIQQLQSFGSPDDEDFLPGPEAVLEFRGYVEGSTTKYAQDWLKRVGVQPGFYFIGLEKEVYPGSTLMSRWGKELSP